MLISLQLIVVQTASAQSSFTDAQISVSPPSLEISSTNAEKITKTIEVTTKNFPELAISVDFREYDAQYKNEKISELFKSVSNVDIVRQGNVAKITLTVTTETLQARSYFWGLGIIVGVESKIDSIQTKGALVVPIRFTVRSSGTIQTALPEFMIKPQRHIFLGNHNIRVKTQIINQSTQLMDFGAELLVLDHNNHIKYRETVSPPNGTLSPKEVFQKALLPNPNPTGFERFLPRRLHLLIRGTVNNERHIETAKVPVWVVPTEFIAFVTIVLLGGILLLVYRRKK
jgi:hypothetical protein